MEGRKEGEEEKSDCARDSEGRERGFERIVSRYETRSVGQRGIGG